MNVEKSMADINQADARPVLGFIGLGRMGRNMALRLIDQGHRLVVTDVDEAAAAAVREAGAIWSPDVAGVAQAADVVLSSLPGPPQVEAVVYGAGGLLENIRPGALYIDLSTSSSVLAQRLDADFRAKGAGAIDAPVSGGSDHCRTGTLTIFVGADDQQWKRAEPILDDLAADLLHIGPVGTGQVVKIVNNAIGLSSLALFGELFALAAAAGLDHRRLFEVLQKGAYARGDYFNQHLPNVVFPQKYDPAKFALAIGHKDVGLAVSMAKDLKVPTPLVAQVEQQTMELIARGHADHDATIIYGLAEARANVRAHDADVDTVTI
jgi:3-hydroxyisobutyrate dehydrogenase